MPPVRATFYLDGAVAHTASIPGGSARIPAEVDEGELANSANAEIPAGIIQPGLEMVVEVDPDGTLAPGLGVAKRIPETGRMRVDVRDMPPFQLTVVPFIYDPEPDSSILEITAGMADDPTTYHMLKDTRELLPIGTFDVELHDPVRTSTNNGFLLRNETEMMRQMEGRPGYWLGMLAPVPRFGLYGVAYGIPSWTSFSVPQSATVAHELGHNMGL